MSAIKCLQVNLHHAVAATDEALRRFIKQNMDVLLVQEPWVRGSRITGLPSRSGKLIYHMGDAVPRAALFIKNHVSYLPISRFIQRDIAAVLIDVALPGGRTKVAIASAYHHGEDASPPEAVRSFIQHCKRMNLQFIIGCDSNSHHTAWASSDTNQRGEELFDFLVAEGVVVVNSGSEPTFRNAVREEVLDLTLTSPALRHKITNWHVSREPSFSDHMHIRFNLNVERVASEPRRNPRRTNWSQYLDLLESNEAEPVGRCLDCVESLDEAAETLRRRIISAYEGSCEPRGPKTTRDVPWWNASLAKLRRKARSLYNKWSTSRRLEDKTAYRKAMTEYCKQLREAKRRSWRAFCQEVVDTPTAARLHKVLAKEHCNGIGELKKGDGTLTSTNDETLSLLLATHFPGSNIFQGNRPVQRVEAPIRNSRRLASKIFTGNRIRWAIRSFKPYKSPGGDGIYPIFLQKGLTTLMESLIAIFRASFIWGYVPNAWRDVRVCFIPKAGRRPSTEAKSFRPISLSSFLLKTMEKIIDHFIRAELLVGSPLHKDQFAYQSGKSTISALHSLTTRLEKAIKHKEIALCAFIDIEGAFSNTTRQSIHQALVKRGVEPAMVAWILASLDSRIINMSLGTTTLSATPGEGCPQGGCLSPLLWSLVVDDLLGKLTEAGFEICGYADDLVIVVRGKHDGTVCDQMQIALSTAHEWCINEGLSINPKKTILVPFTNRRKYSLKVLKMGGVELAPTDHAKYLGVIFDRTLSWKLHVDAVVNKARNALFTCARMAGSTWGLKPKMMDWLYRSIVRPIISYAAFVWWPTTKVKARQLALDKLQRTACLAITGASRSCPTAAMQVILDLPPLAIFLESEAAKWAIKTLKQDKMKSGDLTGHMRILNECQVPIDVVTDVMPIKHQFVKNYIVTPTSREQWARAEIAFPRGSLVFYTDGSKMEDGRVSAGVFGPRIELAVPMGLGLSVFQAEVYAIMECVAHCRLRDYRHAKIYILSDSKAALQALDSFTFESKLVWECMLSLNSLGVSNKVTLMWVPGHASVHGNEMADRLAKEGAVTPFIGPQPFCGFPKSHQAMVVKDWENRRKIAAWSAVQGQRQAKRFLSYSSSWTKKVLSLSKNGLRKMTGLLTGHCPVNYHLRNIGAVPDASCRFCKEATETAEHLLCECEAVHRQRLSHLDSRFLIPEEVCRLATRRVVRFIESLLPEW